MRELGLQQQIVSQQFSQNQLVGVESIPSVVFAPSKYEYNQSLGEESHPFLRQVYGSIPDFVKLFDPVQDDRHQHRNGPREEALHRPDVTLQDIPRQGRKPPLPEVYDLGQQNQDRLNLGAL